MKKILEHDNWVEIPAGEFLTGLSEIQRNGIVEKILQMARYEDRSTSEKALLDNAAPKLGHFPTIRPTPEERGAFHLDEEDIGRMLVSEEALSATPPQTVSHLERFYIARFAITEIQYRQFLAGIGAEELPDALDEPEVRILDVGGEKTQVPGRWASPVQTPHVVRLCEALGTRLPSSLEWEKAARGTDGRLYPWGNEWDPAAGSFFRGQSFSEDGVDPGRAVTGYPRGVSPYGVWGMAGTYPELVTVTTPRPIMTRLVDLGGQKVMVDIKGCHTKETSEEWAWFDHILALPGRGFWVSARLVMDKWPRTQWTGARPGESR
jgi:formylglycine-generating enzyme required for sulfatase activity